MAREFETDAQGSAGSPDWEKVVELDEILHRRATKRPPNPEEQLRIRFGIWLLRLQDRRLTWSHDGLSYVYDGTRSRFSSMYRFAGAAACITEMRQDFINYETDQAIVSRRTIGYQLGSESEGNKLLQDRQGAHEVRGRDAHNMEAVYKQIKASDAVQAELHTDVPNIDTYPQLVAWMKLGEALTRPYEEG